MKNSMVKLLLIIPTLLFLDWIIMVIIGCISNFFGANNSFFCTIYCNVGITILILTLIFIVYVIFKINRNKSIIV